MMIRSRVTTLVVVAITACLLFCECRPTFPAPSLVWKGVGATERDPLRRSSVVGLIGRTEFENEETATPESESSESSNEQESGVEDEENPQSRQSGLQVVISRKMKRILTDELKYLPDEVEDMEPQIAKILIDRSLIRPRKGIPSSWRRKRASDASNGDWSRLRKYFSETFRDAVSWTKSFVLPFLPAIVIGTTVWLQRDLLLGFAQALWSRVYIRRSPADEYDDYRGANGWQEEISTSRSRSSKLDLKAYEKVRKPSFVDNLLLRTKAWRTSIDW